MIESKGRGVLDTPQEPVIGLAEGETRWRGMTFIVWNTKAAHPYRCGPESAIPRSARKTFPYRLAIHWRPFGVMLR
jgi:hypothetical protein